MRELRFRAWDGDRKIMLNEVWIDCDGSAVEQGYQNFNQPTSKQFLTPMQYTGLKDKNGKEIYEGDILRFSFTANDIDREGIAKVVFLEGAFMVFSQIKKEWGYVCDGWAHHDFDYWDSLEVIGNIYENAELLDE